MSDWLYLPFEIIRHYAERGKSVVLVGCGFCQSESLIYSWSWGGHGKARCRGCDGWFRYGNPEGEVAPTAGQEPKP